MSKTTKLEDQNPEHLFSQAICFEYSSCVLAFYGNIRLAERNFVYENRSSECPTLMPSVVLSAFSLEMYLKCIALLSLGEYPHKHTLADLFSSLKDDTQAEIISNFDYYMNNAIPEMRPQYDKDGIEYPDGYYSFKEAIKVMNNAFIAWRYPGALKDVAYLEYYGHWPLAMALKTKILSLHPSWQVWIDMSEPYPESMTGHDPHA